MDDRTTIETAWIAIDRAEKLIQMAEIKADKSNLQYVLSAINAMEEASKYLATIINKEVDSDGSGT